MLYNISKINIRQKNNLPGCSNKLGTVEAVFSSVCLIQTGEGLLLALQNNEAVLSPMSILVPDVRTFSNLGLVQGDSVFNYPKKSQLVVGEMAFDYSQCQFYASWAPIRCQELTYSNYLVKLEEYLGEKEAFLYSYLYGAPPGKGRWAAVEDLLGWRLREALELIREGLKMAGVTEIKQGLQGMLGLGTGLTPSGDDFFLGLATALLTSIRYARIIKGLKACILDLSKNSTTRVSHAFISYFLEGCYSWPVFKLIEALNSNEIHSFARLLPAVGEFGHSSGQDYLSGLWWGFKFLDNQAPV